MHDKLKRAVQATKAQMLEEWGDMVKESGQTQEMFIALNPKATQYLAAYESARQCLIDDQGYDMGPLLEGVEVKLS